MYKIRSVSFLRKVKKMKYSSDSRSLKLGTLSPGALAEDKARDVISSAAVPTPQNHGARENAAYTQAGGGSLTRANWQQVHWQKLNGGWLTAKKSFVAAANETKDQQTVENANCARRFLPSATIDLSTLLYTRSSKGCARGAKWPIFKARARTRVHAKGGSRASRSVCAFATRYVGYADCFTGICILLIWASCPLNFERFIYRSRERSFAHFQRSYRVMSNVGIDRTRGRGFELSKLNCKRLLWSVISV